MLSALPVTALGSLEWKKTVIDHKAKPEDEEVTALFHFANTGDTPVEILGIKTSCGCTVAEQDKKIYLPGEMGTIKVKFTFEGRTGEQSKNVRITTNDPQSPLVLLTLNVDIPEFLSIEPQLLFWTRDEVPVFKSTIISVLSKTPVYINKIESENENFDYELTKLEDGRRYRIRVTPKDTKVESAGKLTLVTNVGGENSRKAFVLMKVY